MILNSNFWRSFFLKLAAGAGQAVVLTAGRNGTVTVLQPTSNVTSVASVTYMNLIVHVVPTVLTVSFYSIYHLESWLINFINLGPRISYWFSNCWRFDCFSRSCRSCWSRSCYHPQHCQGTHSLCTKQCCIRCHCFRCCHFERFYYLYCSSKSCCCWICCKSWNIICFYKKSKILTFSFLLGLLFFDY